MIAKLVFFMTKYRVRIILYAMILTVIIPILIYASKSFPVADDFGNTRYVRDSMVSESFFLTAVKLAGETYVRLGGNFFSAFLNYFFTPFLRGGIVGIRIFNTIMHIVFYISVFVLVRFFSKHILKADSNIALFLYFAFIFCLVNNRVNSDVYSWYVVLVAYILPTAILMFCHSILIYSVCTRNRMYIPAAILAFLVSGSSLNITALNCGLLLLLWYLRPLLLGHWLPLSHRETLLDMGSQSIISLVP